MSVKIGSARSSYGNTTRGDQHNGLEVSTQQWYRHSKNWIVLRANDPAKREKIAVAMERACANNLIGYSQPDRLSLKKELESYDPVTYDPATIKSAVNCDCSSLVRVCCFYAGIQPENFVTANEVSKLMATGEFTKLTDSKYTDQSAYLCRGDIEVTASSGHTIVILSNGSKADQYVETVSYKLGDSELKNGMSGDDVKELQSDLIQLGYSCGDWGCDGDYGDATEMAVKAFQSDVGIVVDGIVGSDTVNKLEMMLTADHTTTGTSVMISGGNCYVRSEPNTSGEILGVAYKGTSYTYAKEQSEAGWYKIVYHSTEGWVSGKYAALA